MEKLDKSIRTGAGTLVELDIVLKINEIIDHLILLDKLPKRVKKLEFYDKMHRKEHLKK